MNTSRPILIAGCGPSISLVPDELWFSAPVFAVNRFIVEHHITPEYWTAFDTWSLVECMPMALSKGSQIHLNKRSWHYVKNTPMLSDIPVHWWEDVGVQGIPTNPQTGMVFVGSTHAAVWRAHMLGYDEFYIVGFDCTIGIEPLHNNSHFYETGKDEVYARSWDEQMSYIASALEAYGKVLWNVSPTTEAKITPRVPIEVAIERFSRS